MLSIIIAIIIRVLPLTTQDFRSEIMSDEN